MKRRNFLSVLSAALLLVSQGVSAQSLLHYQDRPQQASSSQSAASAAAEVKSLPNLWPPAAMTKAKAATPTTQAAEPSDVRAMRAPWVPTTGALSGESLGSAAAPDLQVAPQARDLTDLPPCVPVDKYTDAEVVAYPALRFSCVPVRQSTTWYADAGDTVRTTLQAWGKKVGWTVVWKSGKDVTLPSPFAHTGQYEAAATWMFRQLAAEGVLCKVRFYEGNQTIVVALLT